MKNGGKNKSVAFIILFSVVGTASSFSFNLFENHMSNCALFVTNPR